MSIEEAMTLALELARKSALSSNDVPVGAVILDSAGAVVATGTNERELNNDPTAHAEIVALRRAALNTNKWRLDTHTLVVTLEPCAMCAGAIGQSRINRLVFGAWDHKAGAVGSVWDVLRDPRALHRVEVVSGLLAEQSAELLGDFFKTQRQAN